MIFQSTNVVMAMNGAREVDEHTAPELYHVCRGHGYGGPNPNATCLCCR